MMIHCAMPINNSTWANNELLIIGMLASEYCFELRGRVLAFAINSRVGHLWLCIKNTSRSHYSRPHLAYSSGLSIMFIPFISILDGKSHGRVGSKLWRVKGGHGIIELSDLLTLCLALPAA